MQQPSPMATLATPPGSAAEPPNETLSQLLQQLQTHLHAPPPASYSMTQLMQQLQAPVPIASTSAHDAQLLDALTKALNATSIPPLVRCRVTRHTFS